MAATRGAPGSPLVVDSSLLFALASCGLVERVLAAIAGRIFVTPAVTVEVQRNTARRPELQEVADAIGRHEIQEVVLTTDELRVAVSLHSGVWLRSPRDGKDLGEAEVVAVAGARRWSAVLDDRRGRIAMEMRFGDVACVTTPQMLLALVDAGVLSEDEGWSALEVMTRHGVTGHEMVGKRKADWLALRNRFPRFKL